MIAEALSGTLGHADIDHWKPFAAHMSECEQCQPVLLTLKRVPDDPYPYYDDLCGAGQALFVAWADAKLALIARLHELTAPWGMAGLVGEAAEERAAAITAMPGPAAAQLFREPDVERRKSQVRALIAAHRTGGVGTSREREEERRQCAAEDCQTGPYGTHGTFAVSARYPRQRYCCDPCRKRSERRDRARVESTES